MARDGVDQGDFIAEKTSRINWRQKRQKVQRGIKKSCSVFMFDVALSRREIFFSLERFSPLRRLHSSRFRSDNRCVSDLHRYKQRIDDQQLAQEVSSVPLLHPDCRPTPCC